MMIYSFSADINGHKIYECGEVFAVVGPDDPIEHEVAVFDTMNEAVEHCREPTKCMKAH